MIVGFSVSLASNCEFILDILQRVLTPTVIVTCFEYANLFLTAADWYNAYITSRVTNLLKRPRVVLVDGHCEVCIIVHSLT